jgi:thioredoxin 1
MSQAQNVTNDDFQEKVLNSDKTIIVDFYADWCGPCKVLAPVLDEVASEHAATTVVVKVNVDEQSELAQKYGIRGMPTMLFFKNGEIKSTLVGNQPKNEIVKHLSEIS